MNCAILSIVLFVLAHTTSKADEAPALRPIRYNGQNVYRTSFALLAAVDSKPAGAIQFRNSIDRMQGFLGGPCEVPVQNVRVLMHGDATSNNLEHDLVSLAARSTVEDRVIVDICSHGRLGPGGEPCFVTEPRRGGAGVDDRLPIRRVLELFRRIPARHKLLICDACFAGTVGKLLGPGEGAEDFSDTKLRPGSAVWLGSYRGAQTDFKADLTVLHDRLLAAIDAYREYGPVLLRTMESRVRAEGGTVIEGSLDGLHSQMLLVEEGKLRRTLRSGDSNQTGGYNERSVRDAVKRIRGLLNRSADAEDRARLLVDLARALLALGNAAAQTDEYLEEALLHLDDARKFLNRSEVDVAGIDLISGDIHRSFRLGDPRDHFAAGLRSYRNALTVYTLEHLPQQWATTQNNLGNALLGQGTRASGTESVILLAEAVTAFRDVLKVFTREKLPQDWAGTQNNLGAALQAQGIRTSGAEGARLLAEAVTGFRDALKVYTREQLPQQWATTQNNLGVALWSRGIRMSGAESGILLAEAVMAYRDVLKVFTREQLPQDWAGTQNNLGVALSDQGNRTSGAEGARLLAEAVAAYRDALKVYTPERLPQQWATTQSNLGNALKEQGTRASGAEGARLLAEAVTAYRDALKVRTREQLPQDWAATQNNLGIALSDQGTRASGAEGARLLAEAVTAYRDALKVYTPEQLPQDWAGTKNNLGCALRDQGARASGAEGARLLAEAVTAYRDALKVYTPEQLPQPWATTQNNLGNALRDQGARASGAEGARLLAEAVTAYRDALKVYTPEHHPQQWAATQNSLGVALREQGIRASGAEGARLLAEAVTAHRDALKVYTRAQLPEQWANTLINLSVAYGWSKRTDDALGCLKELHRYYRGMGDTTNASRIEEAIRALGGSPP